MVRESALIIKSLRRQHHIFITMDSMERESLETLVLFFAIST